VSLSAVVTSECAFRMRTMCVCMWGEFFIEKKIVLLELLCFILKFLIYCVCVSLKSYFLSKECITVAYYNKSQFYVLFTCVCVFWGGGGRFFLGEGCWDLLCDIGLPAILFS